jgi:serine/threonine protein phosphatase PrpC
VLGSDGLFDVLQNKAIARIACKMNSNAQKVCNELQKELRKKPTGDDCTMVVLHFATQ